MNVMGGGWRGPVLALLASSALHFIFPVRVSIIQKREPGNERGHVVLLLCWHFC